MLCSGSDRSTQHRSTQHRGTPVAKRARASRSSHRPGGQGPSRSGKPAARAASAGGPQAPPLPEPDIELAIEAVEDDLTELTIEEPAAPPVPEPTGRRRSRRATRTRSDDLGARAAAENAWVRADLRRIGLVSAVLLAALAVAWLVFVVLDVLRLY